MGHAAKEPSNCQSLGTAGVARFFGVARFCVCLGILENVDDDNPDKRATVKLGLGSIKYAYTGDKTKLAAFFLREARKEAIAPPQACASTPGEASPGDTDHI